MFFLLNLCQKENRFSEEFDGHISTKIFMKIHGLWMKLKFED